MSLKRIVKNTVNSLFLEKKPKTDRFLFQTDRFLIGGENALNIF